MSWMKYGKPSLSLTLNGVLAGLVGITAGCDAAGDAQLGLAVLGQVLAQDVLQLNRRLSDLAVGHGGVILGHADVVYLFAAAAAEKYAHVTFFLDVYKRQSLRRCLRHGCHPLR